MGSTCTRCYVQRTTMGDVVRIKKAGAEADQTMLSRLPVCIIARYPGSRGTSDVVCFLLPGLVRKRRVKMQPSPAIQLWAESGNWQKKRTPRIHTHRRGRTQPLGMQERANSQNHAGQPLNFVHNPSTVTNKRALSRWYWVQGMNL